MNAGDLEDALELFAYRVTRHGMTEAEDQLRKSRPSDAEEILAEFRRRLGEPLVHQRGLRHADSEAWYLPKPDHLAPRWQFAKSRLGLPAELLDKTSTVADEIVARLGNPRAREITTRGLVLGHVQSGKTTNYLSVAAKALDNDYHLVIVLAGVHNSLRRQTQDRAARTLVHQPGLWWVGTAVGDFQPDGNSLSSHLAGNGKRGLLVVKKHSKILEKLADWLESEPDANLRRMSVLLIDDEADQAGLDVSPGSELEGVHKQLHRIVNLRTSTGERRVAYLAYTATPYANILTSQDRDGLYPRDFIYPLDRPPAYVGSKELFGDAQLGNPVRIEDEESGQILTSGLRDAIRWFVLATAARAGLGRPLETFHSSMLIHTTESTAAQIGYRPVIEQYLQELKVEFETDSSTMESFYETTLSQVPAREAGGDGYVGERTAEWHEVAPHVLTVLDRIILRRPSGPAFKEDGKFQQAKSGVIVDNSAVDSIERLTYSDLSKGQPSVSVIAIGGNTLSRGLTLEGLVCSYFARTARNYDSLMQMGRWFGYRPGYRHLVRVWTTQGLFDWFRELDEVEQELRDELTWMQDNDLSPIEYGPRIRSSPNMNITRAAAMKSVSRNVSYSDYLFDPAWLDLDPTVLATNQTTAKQLAAGLGAAESVGDSILFRGVALDRISTFLRDFRFHNDESRLDKPSLFRYLAEEKRHLEEWNVIFKSTGAQRKSEFDFGGDVGVVGTVVRSRTADASIARIQSLIDSRDHRLDMGGSAPVRAKYRSAEEPPLMVVYAVDAESSPARRGIREALCADTEPIAVSLVFPRSDTFVEYVTPVVTEVDMSASHLDLGDYQNA